VQLHFTHSSIKLPEQLLKRLPLIKERNDDG
jgi:hypothetical protein